MEFEVLKKSHLKRNIIIGVLVVGIINAVVLNFTRAKYRTTQSIPLVNGTINYTPYDLNIVALYIDGIEAEELDSNADYTLDTAQSTCTYKDGSAIPNLTLNYDSDTKTFTITPYTTKGTKCTLYFNGVPSAVDTIESLYQDNQDMLAYDNYSNLRYIGINPDNYILFNGELWRIIGVFSEDTHGVSGEKLVKIIRNDSIGNLLWNDGYVNNWSTSSLQRALNNDYLSGIGNYANNGIKNDTARNMIETVTWKLGGRIDNDATPTAFYSAERGTTVYSGRATTWRGKIALMYPSDYGYATGGGTTVNNRSTCLGRKLSTWNSYYDCYNQNWLYDSDHQWTLSPTSSDSSGVFHIFRNGSLSGTTANTGYYMVRPSIYLKSNIRISGGTGTSSDPYTLEI